MPIERILVIFDAMTRSETVVQKGKALADRCGASLCMYCPVHLPIFSPELFHVGKSAQDGRDELVQECQRHLEDILPDDSDTTVIVEWGHPFEEAVERVLANTSCDLVVLSLRNSRQPSSSEWRLIRSCKRPILIARGEEAYPPAPYVLACVDPTHARDKPAELDRVILAHGQALAAAHGSSLHVLHATGIMSDLRGSSPYPTQNRAKLDEERRKLIQRLMAEDQEFELHFSHSTPAEAILAFVDARQADLCVMGSTSRSWLVEKLIGSTLREVLPDARCDILLIPPKTVDRSA